MKTEQLITSLRETTESFISQAQNLKLKTDKELNWKNNAESWSILECLEHLNLYGKYYLPAIESEISNSKLEYDAVYKPGWLGNYFANSMLPKDKLNKMKTFKDKDPINSTLDRSVIDQFIIQQEKIISLLNNSHKVNINKIRVATSISKLIRLKLGDTFRFVINHTSRHMKQIERVSQLQN